MNEEVPRKSRRLEWKRKLDNRSCAYSERPFVYPYAKYSGSNSIIRPKFCAAKADGETLVNKVGQSSSVASETIEFEDRNREIHIGSEIELSSATAGATIAQNDDSNQAASNSECIDELSSSNSRRSLRLEMKQATRSHTNGISSFPSAFGLEQSDSGEDDSAMDSKTKREKKAKVNKRKSYWQRPQCSNGSHFDSSKLRLPDRIPLNVPATTVSDINFRGLSGSNVELLVAESVDVLDDEDSDHLEECHRCKLPWAKNAQPSNIARHVWRHICEQNPAHYVLYECRLCAYNTSTLDNIYRHLRVQHELRENFASSYEDNRHFITKNTDEQNVAQSMGDEPKSFDSYAVCSQCARVWVHPKLDQLKNHVWRHLYDEDPQTQALYECSVCYSPFCDHNVLIRHLVREHEIHDNFVPYYVCRRVVLEDRHRQMWTACFPGKLPENFELRKRRIRSSLKRRESDSETSGLSSAAHVGFRDLQCGQCAWRSTACPNRLAVSKHVWTHVAPNERNLYRCRICKVECRTIGTHLMKFHNVRAIRQGMNGLEANYDDLRWKHAKEYRKVWKECFPNMDETTAMGKLSIELLKKPG